MDATSGRDALDHLFWRAEILQAMYWMRGEGLATEVDPASLAAFLGADPALIARHMRQLEAEGYLERSSGYRLTARGAAEGGRSFKDEFADLTRPGHLECGPACWCKDPEHAGEPCPNETGAPRGL